MKTTTYAPESEKRKTVEYLLPAHWASALVNNDFSGLTDEDIKQLHTAMKHLGLGQTFGAAISCNDEPSFRKCHNALGVLPCGCLLYTFPLIRPDGRPVISPKVIQEIDITEFFNKATPSDYSASIAERGYNAGAETWEASKKCEYKLLKNVFARVAARKYFKTFGAWTDEEIDTWTDRELNALMVQLVAGDMRECSALVDQCGRFDWAQYEKESEAGRISGRMFQTGEKIYFSICE